jgi:pilus assembly protein TadC
VAEPAAIGLLLAAARAAWPPPARGNRVTGRAVRRRRAARPVSGNRRRWLLPVCAGVAAALLLGGPGGLLAGAGLAVSAELLLRRERRGADDTDAVTRDLPVACDLLAVCLAAGVPVGAAVGAVAAAVDPPLRTDLELVAGLYRLGAEPARAWASASPSLAPLARAVVRAGRSGSAVGAGLRALAAECRAGQRTRADAAVRRAGVWVLAPLGACFLPAFVCLGVVPMVLGIAADVFG